MTDWVIQSTPVYSRPPLLSSRRSCAPAGKLTPFPDGEGAPSPRLVLPASRVPRTPRSGSAPTTRTTACAPRPRRRREADPPAKPKGGYRIITAAVLAAAWWAYRHKLIRLVDLRVWFAAHEMDATTLPGRTGPPPPVHPRGTPQPHRPVPQAAQGLPPPAPGRTAPELVGDRPRIPGLARRPAGRSSRTTSGPSSTGSPTRTARSPSPAESSGSWPAAHGPPSSPPSSAT